jgi:hypothetical protein
MWLLAIKGSQSVKQPGIPFFVKVQKFSQTTAYADSWLRTTLQVHKQLVSKKDGKETVTEKGG